MALIAIVQTDIKRVVAYSTLSQLGYMTVALGASAYSVAIFHLMTHAFFKAVLFLGAGSVIIAMHHEQDMREHGRPAQVHADHLRDDADRRHRQRRPAALRRLLLQGLDHRGGAPVADAGRRLRLLLRRWPACSSAASIPSAWCSSPSTARSVSATPAHDARRPWRTTITATMAAEPHESPKVVTVPLILLAIPAICVGWLIGPMLFGGYFGDAIYIAPEHEGMAAHGAGISTAWSP